MTEWIHLFLRWTHVFAAILWVGTTYYFTWLDGQLRRLEARGGGAVWMLHSGGFYTVQKQKALGVPPSEVHWFRWEAMVTWVSGFMLLGLMYYGGGLMVAIDSDVSNGAAVGAGIGTLIAGWIVYDLLARSPLVRNDYAFGAVAFILILALAFALHSIISPRATYIHIGALFGTIMAANVWMRILPPQRRMIAGAARGDAIDPSLGAGAKERSKHNTFLAVPAVFLMISNHFPTQTYGSRYAIAVLGVLVVVGWIAAWVIRRG
jgi:uncharacterized membrane protein